MRRGFTLLEILVASTLFLLVIGLAFGYLIPATKAAYQSRVRSHLQQTATVVLAKIRQAAATTSPSGLSWSSQNPVALGFNPVDTLQAGNAVLVWAPSYQLFWWDQQGETLWSADWPKGGLAPTPPEVSLTRAKRLLPERLGEVVSSIPEGSKRAMAQSVSRFAVEHRGDDTSLIQPVTISLELREPNRPQRPPVSRTLTLRLVNQL